MRGFDVTAAPEVAEKLRTNPRILHGIFYLTVLERMRPGFYKGTVSGAVKRERRAKNKVARKSRRINRRK